MDLIYDKLRARGFRSIVINQQAGLGKGNRGVGQGGTGPGDDKWLRFSRRDLFTLIRSMLSEVREGGSAEILDFLSDVQAFAGPLDELFISDDFERSVKELLLSEGMDRDSFEKASDAIAQTNGDFDLMVIYLPGLDHAMHAFGPSEQRGERWFRTGILGTDATTSLHGRINQIVRDLGGLAESTVFGVFSDHGHYDTDTEKYMDLDDRGQFIIENGTPPTWRSTLQPTDKLLVGDVYEDRLLRKDANVIFNPQFGLANIHVAGDIKSAFRYDWTKPPTVEELEPIVSAIFNSYIGPAGALRPWPARPIADILVRVPASPNTFDDSEYKVVPRDYDPNRSGGLQGQLVGLETLEGLGIGEDLVEPWTYKDPVRRVTESISANSGDIVLLANARYGFQFGRPFKGQHGSLTSADSLVPVAFGYPGATGDAEEDNTLAPVIQFLEQFPGDPIEAIVEALALERFFTPEP